jgi:hypothetical protein
MGHLMERQQLIYLVFRVGFLFHILAVRVDFLAVLETIRELGMVGDRLFLLFRR